MEIESLNHTIRALSVLVSLPCLALMLFAAVTPIAGSSKTLLVRFKPGVNDISRVLTSLRLEAVDKIPELGIVVVRTSIPLQDAKSVLSRDPTVDLVEENLLVAPSQAPNDQYYGIQWYLQKIGAPDAWNVSQGDSNTVIAVLDSGVDPGHADLAPRLLSGWNFYDNNSNTTDLTGHGTAVAGVAAAVTNNGIGIASVDWQSSLLPIRVTDSNGYAYYSTLSKGLVYAADMGAKVAVISFEICGGSILSTAAKYFMDKGGLVFAAGGNTGTYVSDPDNPYIISVAGTTSDDVSWGSYGPYIDLSAPCSGMYTTIKGGGYGYVGGTSFSAPLAAGLAALVFSTNKTLTPTQVESILESTAVDLGDPGYDQHYGWGRINASAALRTAAGSPPPGNSTPPGGLTPLVVTIQYPNNGTTVSGGITVNVTTTDNVSVSKVEAYLDGQLYANDTASPYEFYWNTASCSNGGHTLTAKAYDQANNVGQSNPVTVTVSNAVDTVPPTVTINSPSNGSQVSRSIRIVASANDGYGISKVEFYIDGVLKSTVSATPYTYSWNSKSVKNGWHTISVRAYDSSGNSAEATVKVYVHNGK
jgi:thermitase